jgi:hypothetical protein
MWCRPAITASLFGLAVVITGPLVTDQPARAASNRTITVNRYVSGFGGPKSGYRSVRQTYAVGRFSNSNRSVSFRRTRTQTWQGVNKSSPQAVRRFLTPYQPTNNSAGGYFPWMTKRPYGAPMQGTPAARAVCATNPAACPSDIRLKTDITPIGRLASGLTLYRFRYIGDDQVHVGVMAQEVRKVDPAAVTRGADGFLRVNYRRLGLRLQTWQQWAASN